MCLPLAACCFCCAFGILCLARDQWRAGTELRRPDPAKEVAVFHDILAANPRDSGAWINLGLAEERAGNVTRAAQAFASAEAVDRQYLPAWSRANFAFRKGDYALFWQAAARAAPLIYDDARPLLVLAERTGAGTLAILDRLAPDRPNGASSGSGGAQIRRVYVDVLIGQKRWQDALVVARSIREHSSLKKTTDLEKTTEDARRLAAFVDTLIAAGKGSEAIEIWNGLGRFPPLEPQSGRILTNGDFSRAPSGDGFNWRLFTPAGTDHSWRPGELNFILSGQQSDECLLLEQHLVVPTGNVRLLATNAQTIPATPLNSGPAAFSYLPRERSPQTSEDEHFPQSTHFIWQLVDREGKRIARTGLWSGSQLSPARARTQTTQAVLRLLYRRPAGEAVFAGRLSLRHVEVTAVSGLPASYLPKGSLERNSQEVP